MENSKKIICCVLLMLLLSSYGGIFCVEADEAACWKPSKTYPEAIWCKIHKCRNACLSEGYDMPRCSWFVIMFCECKKKDCH